MQGIESIIEVIVICAVIMTLAQVVSTYCSVMHTISLIRRERWITRKPPPQEIFIEEREREADGMETSEKK
jgi:hypothetical protein